MFNFKNEKVVNFKKEFKKKGFKRKFNEKLNDAKEFVYDNRESIMFFTPIVIGGISTIAGVAIKHYRLNKEHELKDLYCYDRSLGHYWRLRRELSNSEWLEIEKRKQNGEALGDILEQLKVLK